MQELKNPLKFETITDMLQAVLNIVIVIAMPIIIFFLIYAGFMYVTARGNPEKVKIASQSLLYGVIGGVVVLGSIAILQIVKSLVSNF